jgi:hypothetical protein
LGSDALSNRLSNIIDFLLVLCIQFFRHQGLNIEDKFDEGASDESGSEMSGQIVMQEKLATHQEKGRIMCSPGEEEEPG